MMALVWRMPDPALITQWRGPDGRMVPSALAVPPMPLATLVGPPGVAGPPGATGPIAELIDCGTFA